MIMSTFCVLCSYKNRLTDLVYCSYLYSLSPTSQTIQVMRLNSAGTAEIWQSYSFEEAAKEAGFEIGTVHFLW